MTTESIYFLDIETTGLDPSADYMLEIAVLEAKPITVIGKCDRGWGSLFSDADRDGLLKNTCRSLSIVINPDEGRHGWPVFSKWRDRMNDFVRDMHEGTGLSAEVDRSPMSLRTAEWAVLEFLAFDVEKPVIAGNSIHFDRSFIRAQMPLLHKRLHHRMLDVSAIRMMVQSAFPSIPGPEGKVPHRALPDARRSLEMYRYYVEQLAVMR